MEWLARLAFVALMVPAPVFAQDVGALAEGVAVVPPRTPAALEDPGRGLSLWLHRRLADAELDVLPFLATRQALAPVPDGGFARAQLGLIHARTGAAHALLTDLTLEAGWLSAHLRLYETGSAELLAAGRASGPLVRLDPILREALGDLIRQVGFSPATVQAGASLRVANLAALGRGLAQLDRGAWSRTIREIEGDRFEEATLLAELAHQQAASVGASTRAYLEATQGRFEGEWLRLRHSLGRTEDPLLLGTAGLYSLARKNADDALGYYGRVLALEPENAAAHLGHGHALTLAGRGAEALSAYREATRLDSQNPAPLRALSRNPDLGVRERARLLLQLAFLEGDRFDVRRARRELRAAAHLDPELAGETKLALGRMLEGLGLFEEAKGAYAQGVAVASGEVELWSGLGRAEQLLGNETAARDHFVRALELEPRHRATLLALGTLHASDEDYDQARIRLEGALAATAGFGAPELEGPARRALARVLVAQGDSKRALGLLDTNLDSSCTFVLAVKTALLAGQAAQAEGLLQAGLTRFGENPELLLLHAQLLEDRGEHAASEAARSEAVALAGSRSSDGSEASDPADPELTERLIAELPVRNAESGEPVAVVILLGVVDERGVWFEWMKPRTLDLGAIEHAVTASLATRFAVAVRPTLEGDLRTDVDALLDLNAPATRIAYVNGALGADATFVARVLPATQGLELELRQFSGRAVDGTVLGRFKAPLPTSLAGNMRWNPVALTVYFGLLLLLVLRALRGWGEVRVCLEGSAFEGGLFSIKLSRQPNRPAKDQEIWSSDSPHRKRSSGRFHRTLASRENRFRFVPTGEWYLGVHALLADKQTRYVERKLTLGRFATEEVLLDLAPQDTEVDLCILEGAEPAEEAMAGVSGRPETLRYVRWGITTFRLGLGSHRLMIAGQDRVIEQVVEISCLEPISLEVDLTDNEACVFWCCAEAVEPYLQGHIAAAAAALEAVGQEEVARQLLGQRAAVEGMDSNAAVPAPTVEMEAAPSESEQVELADPEEPGLVDLEAADSGEDPKEATQGSEETPEEFAQHLERSGEHDAAAEVFHASGDPLKAAKAYEAAYDYHAAIECYRGLEDHVKVMELLEKTGAYYEAAELALERQQLEPAIRNLESLDLLNEGNVTETLDRLIQLMTEDDEGRDPDLQARFASLLEMAGRDSEALAAWKLVRTSAPSHDQAAERIEDLSRRLGIDRRGERAPSDRYEILEEVGRGGMGVVFKARDKRLGRIVALKRLSESLNRNPTFVELFVSEAKAAASLNHPNIVTLFDADHTEGSAFLTMEFLDGKPLDRILQRQGKFSARDVARVGIQMTAGLKYAHDQRIVHRDIKTGNFFFTQDRVVKIMDFGLAKVAEEVRRSTTVIAGTPYYMAPEQSAGEEVDHRADLYALGVTFFELATGELPFTNGDIPNHHRHTPPPDPREKVPGLPGSLARLILDLLIKDPDQRLGSTAVVHRALREIREDLGRVHAGRDESSAG